MIIIRIKWHDWNGEDHSTNVTSDMCEALTVSHLEEEDMFSLAIKYIKRRYTEWYRIDSAELIAS